MPAFSTQFFVRIARLALPIMLSMASSVVIGLVDTAMISPLGEVQLAAAGLTATIVMLFYPTLFGFVSMANIRMANAQGAKNESALDESVWVSTAMSIWVGLAGAGIMALCFLGLSYLGQPQEVVDASLPYYLGIAFSLILFTPFYTLRGYFDSVDQPWIGLAVGLVALISNVPLNYLFIYGIGPVDGLGIVGAAIATNCSYALGLVVMLYLLRKRFQVRVSNLTVKIKNLIGDSLPISAGFAGEAVAFTLVGLMVGLFGTAALAANQIANAFASVLYMVPLGISMAISVLAGQAIGRDKPTEARALTIHAVVFSAGWMLLCAGVLSVSAEHIATFFGPTVDVIELGTGLLIVYALMQVGDGIQSAALGGLRGMGDTRWPVRVTLLGYGGLSIPVAALLGFYTPLGVYGLWVGYAVGLYVVGGVLCWRLYTANRNPISTQ